MSPADCAIVNARVRTMDPSFPVASAVAWRDGLIVAIGDELSVRAHCDATTEVVDASGAAVTPGIIDGHQHLFMGAEVGRGALPRPGAHPGRPAQPARGRAHAAG